MNSLTVATLSLAGEMPIERGYILNVGDGKSIFFPYQWDLKQLATSLMPLVDLKAIFLNKNA